MRILLDMNLSPRLAPVLERNGHVCVHWSAAGDSRADDRSIMRWAAENGYVVLTHDLDFGAVLAAAGEVAPSVIQIRTQDTLSESFQSLLVRVLREFQEMLEEGALIVVDAGRLRARVLPLRQERKSIETKDVNPGTSIR